MKKITELVKLTSDEENLLKQNFIKKLDDKNFVELTNTLNCSDDVLMKYTSSLEDAALEFGNCQKCMGLAECKNKLCGYAYLPIEKDNNITFEYKACLYKMKEIENNKYKDNIKLFDTPKKLMEANMKNISNDDKNRIWVIKYFKYFIDHYNDNKKPKGIYLYGNFGTGKSYLIAALINELAKQNIRSAIVYVPEFLRLLKSSFSSDYEEKYDYIKTVPVLLLDDIGAENLSNWARDEIIGTILQYRMDQDLPTFFTSNLDLNQLEEHFSTTASGIDKLKAKRLIERITYLTEQFKLTSMNRSKNHNNIDKI